MTVEVDPSKVAKRLLKSSKMFLKLILGRATIYSFGPFRVDAETKMLFRGSEPLPIGRRAVEYVCSSAGVVR